jgi:hypothetical protein
MSDQEQKTIDLIATDLQSELKADLQTNPELGRQFLELQLKLAIGVTVRGIISLYSRLAPEVILPVIARQTGTILMGTMAGALAGKLKIREALLKAFEDGLQAPELADETMDKPKPEKPPVAPVRPVQDGNLPPDGPAFSKGRQH